MSKEETGGLTTPLSFTQFERIYLLTTMRTQRALDECERVGIVPEVCFSKVDESPHRSFCLSMLDILQSFVDSGADSCLILEDDVIFKDVSVEFDDVWDIIYLGGNFKPYPDFKMPEYESPTLRRVFNAWTTHAVGYKAHVARWIVDNYDTGIMFDCWLDKQLHKFNTMAVVPMIAEQLPSYSTIWQREVDYSDTFKAGNEFLQSIR